MSGVGLRHWAVRCASQWDVLAHLGGWPEDWTLWFDRCGRWKRHDVSVAFAGLPGPVLVLVNVLSFALLRLRL